MTGLPLVFDIVAAAALFAVVGVFLFLAVIVKRYQPVVGRIFEVRPVFLPLQITPEDRGESVSFKTNDGVTLSGTYLERRGGDRVGQLVFCHEYLSNRWSYLPYLDQLRDAGYDIFTFDFRNHGESESSANYSPLQWVTDYEVNDVRAALEYLRSREDHDSAGFGLFGVSRGGSAALVVGAEQPDVWGVITDGAFPIRGTMTSYILRWAEIYVQSQLFLKYVPVWVYEVLGWASRQMSQRRLNCRFPSVEAAVRSLSPRPWLMIHGERDAYISPEIATDLFAIANEPKEMWVVPDAKHNRCRECQPATYAERVQNFLTQNAPRRPIEAEVAGESAEVAAVHAFADRDRAIVRGKGAGRRVASVTASLTS